MVGLPVVTAHLRLLGGFELTAPPAGPVELPTGAQRLAALLALRGRAGRSRVAGTLWPDTDEVRAKGCLRTAIWRANQIVPGLVQAPGGALQLSAAVVVDAIEVVGTARAAISGLEVDIPFLPDDLLPEWDDPWLLTDRERLRQLYLHMLEAQARRLVADGRYGLAIEAALAALRLDPLRESAHRLIIEIHVTEGNLGEAWRSFRHCATVLDEELGLHPSIQTRRLLDVSRDAGVTAG